MHAFEEGRRILGFLSSCQSVSSGVRRSPSKVGHPLQMLDGPLPASRTATVLVTLIAFRIQHASADCVDYWGPKCPGLACTDQWVARNCAATCRACRADNRTVKVHLQGAQHTVTTAELVISNILDSELLHSLSFDACKHWDPWESCVSGVHQRVDMMLAEEHGFDQRYWRGQGLVPTSAGTLQLSPDRETRWHAESLPGFDGDEILSFTTHVEDAEGRKQQFHPDSLISRSGAILCSIEGDSSTTCARAEAERVKQAHSEQYISVTSSIPSLGHAAGLLSLPLDTKLGLLTGLMKTIGHASEGHVGRPYFSQKRDNLQALAETSESYLEIGQALHIHNTSVCSMLQCFRAHTGSTVAIAW